MKLYQAKESFVFTTIKLIERQLHFRINNKVFIQPLEADCGLIFNMLKLIKKDLTGN